MADAVERDFAASRESATARAFDKRWAVLVGISEYRSRALNLKYAHRDIEELWTLLQTNRCYRFVQERTRKLLNADATTTNIYSALRSFLQPVGSNDLVVLYFAGHAARDPVKKIPYLITHDTDPEDIAATGIPMREILTSVRENVGPEPTVLLFVDTCHSAAVDQGSRALAEEAPDLIEPLQQIARSGTAILTSSETGEASRESAEYGDGHGLFTHLVLEGLRGRAQNESGIVTLGRLIEYVENESREKKRHGGQHPRVAGTFDRELSLAVTGGITARERLAAAKLVFRMGLERGDRRRFASAARLASEAHEIAAIEGGLDEARTFAALSHIGAEDYSAAQDFLAAAPRGIQRYYLAVALAKNGDASGASRELARFAELTGDDPRAKFATLISAMLRNPEGRKRAVLIGINQYRKSSGDFIQLRGAKNDAHSMDRVLQSHFGFAHSEISRLIDSPPTKAMILDELDALKTLDPHDLVIIYFAGHALPRHPSLYLVAHDAELPEGVSKEHADDLPSGGIIGSLELHEHILAIPAKRKILILDTHSNQTFIDLARRRESDYTVLFASQPGETTREVVIENDGKKSICGVMTYALVAELEKRGPGATWADILPSLKVAVRGRGPNQTPMLIGLEHLPVLAGRSVFYDPASILRMSLCGEQVERSGEEIREWYTSVVAQLDVPSPDLHAAVGSTLLMRGTTLDAAVARTALERAARELGKRDDELSWSLALACARVGDQGAALAHLHTPPLAIYAPAISLLARRAKDRGSVRPRALVIGIDSYVEHEKPDTADARGDARFVERALIDHCGFAEDRVTTLLDPDSATLRTEISRLLEHARSGPAFLYFAGAGSQDAAGQPTILASDARTAGVYDIPLSSIDSEAGSDTNLVCVFCTSFAITGEWRSAALDLREDARRPRDVSIPRVLNRTQPVGRVSIFPRTNVPVTGPLIAVLRESDPYTLTYGSWVERASNHVPRGEGPKLFARDERETWMTNAVAETQVRDAFLEACRMRWREAVHLLERMIGDTKDPSIQALIDLAVAKSMAGDTAGAISVLDEALVQNDHPEARYWRGRLMLDNGNAPGAMSELERAAHQTPNDPALHYFLGAAIRAVMEGENRDKVRRAWTRYLELGAPLGHRDEVAAFLEVGH